MLKLMTSPQLAELEAFWTIEGGWGEWKQDYRFGQLCALHANINRDSKRTPRAYKPDDFIMRPKDVVADEGAVESKIRVSFDMLADRGKSKKKRKPQKKAPRNEDGNL